MALSTGARLGPYEIQSVIGSGGMGEVYRAKDTRLDRDVAVKVLRPIFASNQERLKRFEQEARAAGMLSHPNILAIYDIGTEGSNFSELPIVTDTSGARALRRTATPLCTAQAGTVNRTSFF